MLFNGGDDDGKSTEGEETSSCGKDGKADDRFTDGEENVCIWSIMGMPMMVHSAMAKKTLLVVKDSDAAYGTFTDDKEDFFILS